jgi:hypothetical protein
MIMGVFRSDDSFFDGVHTTHGGTVGIVTPIQIARSDTLKPSNLFGWLSVRGADQVAVRRACGCQDSLKIHAGYNVFEASVVVCFQIGGVKGLKARGQNDSPNTQMQNGFFLLKINGIIFTELLAGLTFSLLASINGLEIEAMIPVYGVLQGNGLGKRDIHSLALTHAQVENIGHLFGAFGGTNAAPYALVFINIARMRGNLHLEVTCFAANAVYFSQGDEVDVGVPADLDQFG